MAFVSEDKRCTAEHHDGGDEPQSTRRAYADRSAYTEEAEPCVDRMWKQTVDSTIDIPRRRMRIHRQTASINPEVSHSGKEEQSPNDCESKTEGERSNSRQMNNPWGTAPPFRNE